jgi:hypothetical protein
MSKAGMAWTLALAIASSALLMGGCVRREHLRADHGEAYREWFAAQQRTTETGPADGLDSEEAAAIYGLYRGMLRGDARGRSRNDSPVLLLPDRGHERSR